MPEKGRSDTRIVNVRRGRKTYETLWTKTVSCPCWHL